MPRAVTSLSLSHFRSHRRAHLVVDARPVVLCGPNGAGKTNLLEALSLLSPGRGLRRAAAVDLARRPEALGWRIGADLRAGDRLHEIDLRAEAGQSRATRIDGKAASQTQLGQMLPVLWLVPSMDRLWLEGAEGRRRFLDRMTLSFFPDHAGVSLDYDKAMRDRNRLLKDQVQDGRWYDALEARMAESGARIHAHRSTALDLIAEAQDRAETAFPAATLAMIWPDGAPLSATQDGLAEAFARARRADLRAGRSLVGPHRADLGAEFTAKGVTAAQCSTGEQKALLISLLLSNARALRDRDGAAPLVLLDEIAAHLDEQRRSALYDEICALGAQAWMTGTEAHLFDALGGRGQRFEITETGGESIVAEA
ncbi:MAG: DNA replication/repair protein RecF [Rhodobacteraceae bacterium]|nr:DNA replication/repair protein RecF [Paracoccaceae bacterium]